MIVNGKMMDIDTPISVSRLFEIIKKNPKLAVVEVDMEIVDKSQYDNYIIDKESRVEIVSFVGGG
ncbi:MAG: sulfur carrier protein ThiS [Tissierellales bacterium]|nr:sulfur carrier protein ThiS [Tissierellales bacterium]